MSGKACGGCRHWHEWSEKRHKQFWDKCNVPWFPGDLRIGNCDRIARGTPMPEGRGFDGYAFEDECYDDCFGCFEEEQKQ